MTAAPPAERRIALIASGAGSYTAVELDEDDAEVRRDVVTSAELAGWVAEADTATQTRWIIRSARETYATLLADGVILNRTHDLLLCHAILRDTDAVARPLAPSQAWVRREPTDAAPSLFDALHDDSAGDPVDEALEQYREQRRVIASGRDGRLTLLCAAESAGGLIAEEMRVAGLPWDVAAHDAILTETLGARAAGGGIPSRMAELGAQVRSILGDETLHLDSQQKLLRALHRVGVHVESTSRWELAEQSHAVVEPLLAYKKMSRLLSANGWAWLAEWVHDGRFRPVYIPGGVVTGRWASAGGGALQLPRSLRPAVRADPGWTLIVADVAQLEPRMLAAMSSDRAMARAAQGRNLYAGGVTPARSAPARRRSTPCSVRCTARPPATAADSSRDCARCTRGRWRTSTPQRAPARTGGSCRRGSDARRRGRLRSGRACSPRPPRPTPTLRWSHSLVVAHGTGGGSPATSSCRAPQPSGR